MGGYVNMEGETRIQTTTRPSEKAHLAAVYNVSAGAIFNLITGLVIVAVLLSQQSLIGTTQIRHFDKNAISHETDSSRRQDNQNRRDEDILRQRYKLCPPAALMRSMILLLTETASRQGQRIKSQGRQAHGQGRHRKVDFGCGQGRVRRQGIEKRPCGDRLNGRDSKAYPCGPCSGQVRH